VPGYGGGHGRGGGSADTPVTGAELTKVTNAMKAKDSGVTVTSVRKDPDGSYDVYGTKAGAQVAYDVSADLSTFTARTGGGGRGGHGGPGGSADTQVTGAELTQVADAVKAKDAAVTVTSVRRDPDGSYDVFGTKAGAQVMFEVSKDLKTITQNSFGGRPGNGPQQPGDAPQQQSPTPNA
jgi:CO/xanthine dehydrogenase Mo-binding subunit